MTARAYVDWERVALVLDSVCEERGLSLRAAAKQLGFAASSLTRLRQGHALSADNYVTLLLWLNPAESWHWSWMSEVPLDGA